MHTGPVLNWSGLGSDQEWSWTGLDRSRTTVGLQSWSYGGPGPGEQLVQSWSWSLVLGNLGVGPGLDWTTQHYPWKSTQVRREGSVWAAKEKVSASTESSGHRRHLESRMAREKQLVRAPRKMQL